MTRPRPGRPHEERTGRYWREVCACGWIGRQYSSHLASPATRGHHVRVRWGWFKDLEATVRVTAADYSGGDAA